MDSWKIKFLTTDRQFRRGKNSITTGNVCRREEYIRGGKRICSYLLRPVDQPRHGDRNIRVDFSSGRVIKHESRYKSWRNDIGKVEQKTGRCYSLAGN